MKFKRFKQGPPTEDGDYWYKSNEESKPQILFWDNSKAEFKGSRDRYGFQSFIPPKFWCEIKYPEL